MITIQQIRQPVHDLFGQFQNEYINRIQSSIPTLQDVASYLHQYQGKQLRPLLVLLSAKACNTAKPQHLLVATALELLHNSSLMHDDVVDESDSRRGHAAIRKQWGNQIAVLCGDFFLSQTMKALYDTHDDYVVQTVNKTVATMCEGELHQLATSSQPLNESNYIDIIGCKTASLMAACCQLGAYSFDGKDSPFVWHMRDFGYHYGLVFQMRDDIDDHNARHDATPRQEVDTLQLIDQHTRLAVEALSHIPPSEARQALRDLLTAEGL